MATTNDEHWQAWINRMYRDEEKYWNELRLRVVPDESQASGTESLTDKEKDDAEGK